jgi:hypothetical protein
VEEGRKGEKQKVICAKTSSMGIIPHEFDISNSGWKGDS